MEPKTFEELGTIKKAREIGRRGRDKYIWARCPDCGKERWVAYRTNRHQAFRCQQCNGRLHCRELSPRWKGGRSPVGHGYIGVTLHEDDFFYPMADKTGRVLEHRLVMAKYIGRCLHRWELVHHKNGVKGDNRIGNLQIVTDERHKQITILEKRIKWLEERVLRLEVENVALRQCIKE